ncbi:MAG: response regulator [Acaryochloridaceae cyanobacterium RU_4_10]|nr:response regulator [Acaryochloridaceae cyanobacterium RU_4_10]
MNGETEVMKDTSPSKIGLEQRVFTLVLIADDDDAIRTRLRHIVEAQGYEVIEAKNGKECIHKYLKFRPDLVLLDWSMPEMDGYTCCKILRRLPNADLIPIVAIASLNDSDSIQRALAVGFTDYILKPFLWSFLGVRFVQLVNYSKLLKRSNNRNAEYRRQGLLDDLTQIFNKKAFDRFLNQEWYKSLEGSRPISLILANLNLADIHNDEYGQVAADKCLHSTAQTIRYSVYRSSDLVCRSGDEEFGIILPNTPVSGGPICCHSNSDSTEKFFFELQSNPHKNSS